MAVYKKTGVFAVSPELNINRYHIFLDRHLTLLPGEHSELTTSIGLDLEDTCRVSIYSSDGKEVKYQKKTEITIPYQNNTKEIISLKRGLNIGHFFIYKLTEVTLELVSCWTESEDVQIELKDIGVLPRKVDNHYVFYMCSDREILPNELVELKTGVKLKIPDNYAISIHSKFGEGKYIENEEVTVFYRNEGNSIKNLKRKLPIFEVHFFKIDQDPTLLLVERYRGDRKRTFNESTPCCSKSLF